jgi:hypothetical protein
MSNKSVQIFFNQDEVRIISMAIASVMEDLKHPSVNLQPLTPEARKMMNQMLTACNSAARKLEKFAGIKCELPAYEIGDENEFLTKES